MNAPVVLFVYNRPEHTRQTLGALAANIFAVESELFIYSDAPKNEEAVNNVQAVRSLIKKVAGFKSVTIIERDKNFGLANSIIDGVTAIVNQYKKVIVLEDDLVTSPYFLSYMNDALNAYEYENRVISIHGYVYPVRRKLPDYFFLRGADCWGWATWKRGWELFNQDGQFLLDEIKKQKLGKLFNFNNSYDYTGMLQDQIDGKVSSWAVRWYASAFLANKYTLYPGKPFVKNIGFDNSGVHCGGTAYYDVNLSFDYKPIFDIHDSYIARNLFEQYFHHSYQKNIIKRIKDIIRYLLKMMELIPPPPPPPIRSRCLIWGIAA